MTRTSRNEKTRYQLHIFHETPRAWMVGTEKKDRENDNSFWLPRSQVELETEFSFKGDTLGNFLIPEWLAEEKGLDPSLHGNDDNGEVLE